MPVDFRVPKWLHDYALCWCDRLGLNDWNVAVRLELAIDGDETTRGAVEIYQNIHKAIIKIRADVEDNAEGQQTVVHELLHVKHEKIDQLVRDVVLPELDKQAANVVRSVYLNVLEEFIELESCLLWRLAQATDAPVERKKGKKRDAGNKVEKKPEEAKGV